MNFWEVALLLLAIGSFPFVVYLTVKLGTVAFFRGRQLFHDSRRPKNGDEIY